MNVIRGQRRGRFQLTGAQAALVLLSLFVLAFVVTIAVWLGALYTREYVHRYEKYDPMIERIARRHGLDPQFVKAVVWKESRFDRTAIGTKGEVGLMQIMPTLAAVDWAREHNERPPSRGALSDPELNLEVGTWYLARAMERWRGYKYRHELALCEYNAGPTRALQWKPELPDGSVMDRITIDSTRKYVSDIMRKFAEYEKEDKKSPPPKE